MRAVTDAPASRLARGRFFWLAASLTLLVVAGDLGCAPTRALTRQEDAETFRVASRIRSRTRAVSDAVVKRIKGRRQASEAPALARAGTPRPYAVGAQRPRTSKPLEQPSHSNLAPAPAVVRSTAPPPGAVLTLPRTEQPPVVALGPPQDQEEKPEPARVQVQEPEKPAAPVAGPGLEPPAVSQTDEPAAAEAPAEADSLEKVRALVADSRAKVDALDTYQVAMNRQERIGAKLQDPEDVVLSIRRDPRAVRLEWREGPSKGREVIYQAGGQMNIYMPNALIPRLSMDPNSPMVLRSSRHPIGEAGFDGVLANVESAITLHDSGNAGTDRLWYEGIVEDHPDGRPCHRIVRVTESGETWDVYLDTKTGLPALVQAKNAEGALLERYLFGTVEPNPEELASADAFSPDARWGAPRGLFSRIAGSPEKTEGRE